MNYTKFLVGGAVSVGIALVVLGIEVFGTDGSANHELIVSGSIVIGMGISAMLFFCVKGWE